MEVDLVDCPPVIIEHLLLLSSPRLVQVPDYDGSIGGRRGNDLVIHRGPDHIIATEIKIDVFSNPEIVSFDKLFLDTEYFEHRSSGNNNLGAIFAEVKGTGRSLQYHMHSL